MKIRRCVLTLFGFVMVGLIPHFLRADESRPNLHPSFDVRDLIVPETVSDRTKLEKLVRVARAYFRADPVIYLKKRRVSPMDDELTQIGFNAGVFESNVPTVLYHPEGEFYEPEERYMNDRYVLYWGFGPDCKHRPEDAHSVAGWFLPDGSPCVDSDYQIHVVVTPGFQAERIDVVYAPKPPPGDRL